jgi:hypothetical protein
VADGTGAGTGVVFDLFTLGALIAASLQFQTDSGAFMAAVKEIAGTSGGNTGINVVDKAAQARSTLKVLQALSNISKLLQVRPGWHCVHASTSCCDSIDLAQTQMHK